MKLELRALALFHEQSAEAPFREALVLLVERTNDYDTFVGEVQQIRMLDVESLVANDVVWKSHHARFEAAPEQYKQALLDEVQTAVANTAETVRPKLVSQQVHIEQQMTLLLEMNTTSV